MRTNQFEKWLWEQKPQFNAIVTIGVSVFFKRSFARSTRRESTY